MPFLEDELNRNVADLSASLAHILHIDLNEVQSMLTGEDIVSMSPEEVDLLAGIAEEGTALETLRKAFEELFASFDAPSGDAVYILDDHEHKRARNFDITVLVAWDAAIAFLVQEGKDSTGYSFLTLDKNELSERAQKFIEDLNASDELREYEPIATATSREGSEVHARMLGIDNTLMMNAASEMGGEEAIAGTFTLSDVAHLRDAGSIDIIGFNQGAEAFVISTPLLALPLFGGWVRPDINLALFETLDPNSASEFFMMQLLRATGGGTSRQSR